MVKVRGNLAAQILIAIAAAFVAGSFGLYGASADSWQSIYLTYGLFDATGEMFLRSLKMMVVPLVFLGLAVGVAGVSDIGQMGRVAIKGLGFYMATTVMALAMSLLVANVWFGIFSVDVIPVTGAEINTNNAPPFADIIKNIIPSNIIEAFAKGDMLAVIFVSVLFGVAVAVTGKETDSIISQLNSLNVVILKMVELIMKLSPIGIFCLLTKIFAESGYQAVFGMLNYFTAMIVALGIQCFVVYRVLLKVFTNVDTSVFYKKFRSVQLFAFSTASSAATMPVTLKALQTRLGVGRTTSSFLVPIGGQVNMDGTSCLMSIGAVFISKLYGIDLTLSDMLMIVGMGTLSSVGTAGVRGAGIIMLSMVLVQVGLPLEGITVILAVDPVLDMLRTAVNVTGDGAGSIIVANAEGDIDHDIFSDSEAGMHDEEIDLHNLSGT